MAKSGYGRIYVSAGAAAQTLNASAGTFDKMTGFATAGINYGSVSAITIANDNIVFDSGAGGGDAMPAQVSFSVSFTVGTAGLYRFAVYQDNAVVAGSERRITCALSTTYTVSGSVLAAVADGSGATFDVRIASDQTGPTITPTYASLEAKI